MSSAARAFFIFGDSLVDNGNNNYLATTARADQPPYGIDTPNRRPTGRFSNGKNVPDIVSEYLGAEPTLPYLSPELQGEKLLVGANFASAGIGILNDTGIQFANIIRITKQLQYFEQYQQRLSSLIGPQKTQRLVNEALVLITLGGNDFVNNYYLVPYSARSREFSLPDYRIYELGSRRVLVTGVGPLGCVPAELALRSRTGACDPELMRIPDLYNPQMIALLNQLNAQFGSQMRVTWCSQRVVVVLLPTSFNAIVEIALQKLAHPSNSPDPVVTRERERDLDDMSSQQLFNSGKARGEGQAEADQWVQSAKDTTNSVRETTFEQLQGVRESQQHAAGFVQQAGAQAKEMAQDAAGAAKNAVGMGNASNSAPPDLLL
ncbi:GDSL esterase/lipase [Canna indica]|uniref:GDSL esterase/lipase n=1 Tax=Canna indica TaxID=4628 RepID=A0AAQ3KWA8_9LILI|nr:GDSL esterase/lipase [Canna indica]